MFISILLILLGLVLLAGGGELLVRGAVGIARRLGLSAAVIGLTVVAAGTSVPELAVSALSAMQDKTDLAIGNVVGSNIFNITFIMGIAALLTPLAITHGMIRLEYPVMLFASFLAVFTFYDGVFDRSEAALFVGFYVMFTAYLVRLVRKEQTSKDAAELRGEFETLERPLESDLSLGRALFLVLTGVLLLAGGAELTVRGAVEIARVLGMSERVIGLTIVACGTSLPEVITSIVSGIRGRDDIAVANVVGSNLFNILVILGISGLVHPLQVAPQTQNADVYWMLGTALLAFPLLVSGKKVTRAEGALLIVVFFSYIFWVLQ